MAKLQRIGQYLNRDIRRAAVIVPLKDELGKKIEVSFTFRGETTEDGEHLKLYMRKEDVEHFSTEGIRIQELGRSHPEADGENTYVFHKEDVYVKSEGNIYYG